MQEDKIIEKAQRLGFNVNSNLSKDDNLYEIANSFGISNFRGKSDLNKLENKLDDLIASETYNESEFSEEELYDNQYDYEELEEMPQSNTQGSEVREKKEDNNRETSSNEEIQSNNQQKNKYAKASKSEVLEDNKNNRTRNRIEEARNKLGNIDQFGKAKDNNENKEDNSGEGNNNPIPRMSNVIRDKAKEAVGNGAKKISSGLLELIKKNPQLLLIIGGIVIVLFVLLLIMGTMNNTGNTDSNAGLSGYYDNNCDINSTIVNIKSCSSGESIENISIEDYVLGVASYYTKDGNYSDSVIKAFMIIVKTNALANGGFGTNGTLNLNDCNVKYESSSTEKLKELYNEINNMIYVSEEYEGAINSLSNSDALYFDNNTIKELTGSSYESVLDNYYSKTRSNVKLNGLNFFIGDSRTVGMDSSVNDIDSSNVVAEVSQGYYWLLNTAIDSANSKMGANKYNVFLWLGVNDLGNIDNYIAKYKELAQNDWKNHNMFVVQVGPVDDSISPNVKNSSIDLFNNKMQSEITNANISNLVYVPMNYNIKYYDESMGVHYGSEDYINIYNQMLSNVNANSNTDSSKKYKLYNYTEYCTFYELASGSSNMYWWPVGSAQTTSKDGKVFASGDPVTLSITDYFGARNCAAYDSEGTCTSSTFHRAIDIGAGCGTNVIASKSGVVTGIHDGCVAGNSSSAQNCGGGCGNWIDIDHGDGIVTEYCHLQLNSFKVKVGENVQQGQVIALSDTTGASSGCHLHFALLENGVKVDPLNYVSPDNPRPMVGSIDEIKFVSGSSYKQTICKTLLATGFPKNGVAGIMSSMVVESGFVPHRLQGDFTDGYVTSLEYTRKVDSGSINRNEFVYNGPNGGGYGLVQWTSEGRKEKLYDYAKSKNRSIGDIEMQLGYFLIELTSTGYSGAYEYVMGNFPDYDKSYYFCKYFEGWNQNCEGRASNYTSEFNAYVKNNCS